MQKLRLSLYQVHSKRLHNGTHVPRSLQSPHSKGIGMITSIWNLPCEPFRFGTCTVTPLVFIGVCQSVARVFWAVACVAVCFPGCFYVVARVFWLVSCLCKTLCYYLGAMLLSGSCCGWFLLLLCVVAGAFGVFLVLMYGFQGVDMRLILLLFGC